MESNKMFELIEKMYIEMQEGFKKVDNQFKNIDSQFKKVDERLSSLESKVDKNTLLLEKANSDIKTLAEVQQSFSEQLDRAKSKEGKTLGERLEVMELAITNTSKSLKDSFASLDGKIDDLQFDVNNLSIKTTKTDNKVILFEKQLKKESNKGDIK